jgi:hypothetical protein
MTRGVRPVCCSLLISLPGCGSSMSGQRDWGRRPARTHGRAPSRRRRIHPGRALSGGRRRGRSAHGPGSRHADHSSGHPPHFRGRRVASRSAAVREFCFRSSSREPGAGRARSGGESPRPDWTHRVVRRSSPRGLSPNRPCMRKDKRWKWLGQRYGRRGARVLAACLSGDQRTRVAWLVERDLAASRQLERGRQSPRLLHNAVRELRAFGG